MVELVYVDEQPEQGNSVIRAAVQSKFFEQNAVIAIEPRPTLEETMAAIDDLKCKVLITDYRLSEFAPNVTFSGTDLVARYQSLHVGFPCFVTTSFANDAADEAVDVNLVYAKSEVLLAPDADRPLPFFHRVRKKIEEHESLLVTLTDRHAELLAKLTSDGLSEKETDELLNIDSRLETLFHSECVMTPDLKRLALQPMAELISKAEQLIADISIELNQDGSGQLT
jgi:hypothetical protein